MLSARISGKEIKEKIIKNKDLFMKVKKKCKKILFHNFKSAMFILFMYKRPTDLPAKNVYE